MRTPLETGGHYYQITADLRAVGQRAFRPVDQRPQPYMLPPLEHTSDLRLRSSTINTLCLGRAGVRGLPGSRMYDSLVGTV